MRSSARSLTVSALKGGPAFGIVGDDAEDIARMPDPAELGTAAFISAGTGRLDAQHIGLAGNGGNDTVLTPSMLEVASSNGVVGASGLDGVTHLLEKPFARLTSALGL